MCKGAAENAINSVIAEDNMATVMRTQYFWKILENTVLEKLAR
jgi:hypothetical protein